ncbi:hypothetical protein C8F04DRAFT_1186894 [Mycena alexandri]|uniref:Uncharacterized protein n=1 Tax=Mycena alexandri TaxID=1745969 RepID=A0AAD6SHE1_9AGAR|nr:hypothetical protein C8F04DRAFT_1189246 [Mycena alexandri]KAJ7030260.1 hypothetical protein C8F04DRAFT_1186894 [Mycena alexandri]
MPPDRCHSYTKDISTGHRLPVPVLGAHYRLATTVVSTVPSLVASSSCIINAEGFSLPLYALLILWICHSMWAFLAQDLAPIALHRAERKTSSRMKSSLGGDWLAAASFRNLPENLKFRGAETSQSGGASCVPCPNYLPELMFAVSVRNAPSAIHLDMYDLSTATFLDKHYDLPACCFTLKQISQG